jgi:hypothetical protein
MDLRHQLMGIKIMKLVLMALKISLLNLILIKITPAFKITPKIIKINHTITSLLTTNMNPRVIISNMPLLKKIKVLIFMNKSKHT